MSGSGNQPREEQVRRLMTKAGLQSYGELLSRVQEDGNLSPPDQAPFFSLAATVREFMEKDGASQEEALAWIRILMDGLAREGSIFHFSTPDGSLGPGRIVECNPQQERVLIQLRGDPQLQAFSLAEIAVEPAAYEHARDLVDHVRGIFWETRTTRNMVERMLTSRYARLAPEEVDSFAEVVHVDPNEVKPLVPLQLQEEQVKAFFCEIIGRPWIQKDWGGELNDTFGEVIFRRRTVPATFAFKGKAYAHRPLRIADLGKNGDQLVRLFSLPAEIYILQSNGPIDGTVYHQVQAQVAQKVLAGQVVYYLVLDGLQTARILRAYGRI
jgi:hypothetical protein